MILRRVVIPQELLDDGPAMELYLRTNGFRQDWRCVARDPLYDWAMIEVWMVLA